MRYFALVMSLVYILFGCLFLFTNFLQWQIPQYRVPLGIVLVCYGILRSYMWRRKNLQSQEEQ